MNIKEILAFIGTIGTFAVMWWQLDGKIERDIQALDGRLTSRIASLETKVEQMNTLLTNNLLEMKGDIGELRGKAHLHTVPASQ